MKKVAIIELSSHFEVARAYGFMLLNEGCKISFFISSQYEAFIRFVFDDNEHVSWHICSLDTSTDAFLSNNIETLNSQDSVLVCTAEAFDGKLITRKWKSHTALVIHDLHNYFAPFSHLSFAGGPIQWLKVVKYTSLLYFHKRKKLLNQFNVFVFPSSVITKYFLLGKWGGQAMTLPFYCNEKVSKIKEKTTCKIVIPGSVNQRSRDYVFTLKVFGQLKKMKLSKKIELVLLGKPKSNMEKQFITQLHALADESFVVVTFEKNVEQVLFDAQMLDADFLFLPLQKSWLFGVVTEIGGTTCLSGNISDMVRYGLPAFLPNDYLLPDELHPMTSTYGANDPVSTALLLKEYINTEKYNEVKRTMDGTLIKINKTTSSYIRNFLKMS